MRLARSRSGIVVVLGTIMLSPDGSAQTAPAFPSNGVHLMSQLLPDELSPPQTWGTKCWGYVSPSGREYAVVGTWDGTCFVEVTDPGRPQSIAFVNGPNTSFRAVKTYQEYAYAVSNAGGGIQVVDLREIDSGMVTHVANVTLPGGWSKSHNVAVNETSGFLYQIGFETGGPGLQFYDLAVPSNPTWVGAWMPVTHDAQVITYTTGPYAGREIAFACTTSPINGLSIVDVTDKSGAVRLAEVTYPNAHLSHQVWLSEDRQWAFLNDEFDEPIAGVPSTTHVFDVSDLDNPTLATSFTNGLNAITHDAFVKGDRLYCANYLSGLRIFDVSDPLNAFETAWFDMWPCNDEAHLKGLYSVYPFFPSGVVIGVDQLRGLFVFTEGDPKLTFGFPKGLPTRVDPDGTSFSVTILENAPGDLVPGSAMLNFDDGSGPQSTMLEPRGKDFVATFPALSCGAHVEFGFSARSTDGFTWTHPQPSASGASRYYASVAVHETVIYADSFEGVESGWTTRSVNVSSGEWERVDPGGTDYAPEDDHSPLGTKCWVTGDDPDTCTPVNEVTGGPYTLTSPFLDLSESQDPHVRYARWFSNIGGAIREDPFVIEITASGGEWTAVDVVGPLPPDGDGGWVEHQFRVRDFVIPSATTAVRFRVVDLHQTSEHGGSPHQPNAAILEAAVDDFAVFEPVCGWPQAYCAAGTSASGCTAALSASGTASASAPTGFDVEISEVEGAKSGVFYFGTSGRQAAPWGTGTSFQCVVPPVQRTGAIAGQGTPGACDGSFGFDLNAYWCPSCQHANNNPGAGAMVQAQFWYRDPWNTSNQTTSFANAIEFGVAP